MSRRQPMDVALVRRMVDAQFPQWAGIPLAPVANPGWDNQSFRLGETMVVRLPNAAEYSPQVAREQHWLPRLAAALPLPIPAPLALGKPMFGYAWPWSIYAWIEGEAASTARVADMAAFATSLAGFLAALRAADPVAGPAPGPDNFFRGGSLAAYDAEVRSALSILEQRIDTAAALSLWDAALETAWPHAPVWVHGDVSPGNLLMREGRFAGVIDFGALAIGDPACDLAIAWTFLSGKSRDLFIKRCALDDGTWTRARAWALWKALVVAAGLAETNAVEWRHPRRVIEQLTK